MVRRTSEKDEEEVNYRRIENVRNSYLQRLRENRQEFLGEIESNVPLAFVKPRITGVCAICSQILTEEFPKDYPKEYKFCCSCLGWAGSIITDKDIGWLKHALKVSPTVKKVYERITVFGHG